MTLKGSATAADLHTRRFVWSSRPSLAEDTYFAIKYFFEYCIERSLSIKLAGDIFHTLSVRPSNVQVLYNQLDKATEAGVPVYFIQGNHDANKVPWLSLYRGGDVQHVDRKVVELPESGETLYGIDYRYEGDLREVLKVVPDEVDTLLMHQAETEALPFGPNFDLSWVPSTVSRVLIGDIHTPQYYRKNSIDLYYPGSLAISDIAQAGSGGHGSFLVEYVKDGKTQVEHVKVPGRDFYEVVIQEPDDIDVADAFMRNIAYESPRHFGLAPVFVIKVIPALHKKAYEKLMFLKKVLDVYPWFKPLRDKDVAGGDQEDDLSDGVYAKRSIFDVVQTEVEDVRVRQILMDIFQTKDTTEVLRSELEQLL